MYRLMQILNSDILSRRVQFLSKFPLKAKFTVLIVFDDACFRILTKPLTDQLIFLLSLTQQMSKQYFYSHTVLKIKMISSQISSCFGRNPIRQTKYSFTILCLIK
uniref:Uncharacterized protein n=1 Tax=Micrurus surinamensis TaxID=129470 RepID=A0A2D4P2D9_MICSU